jgi:hypothetical protein
VCAPCWDAIPITSGLRPRRVLVLWSVTSHYG